MMKIKMFKTVGCLALCFFTSTTTLSLTVTECDAMEKGYGMYGGGLAPTPRQESTDKERAKLN